MLISTKSLNYFKSSATAKTAFLLALVLAGSLSQPADGAVIQVSLADRASVALANSTTSASQALKKLSVKGRAPKTGYSRSLFSDGWGQIANCDLRNYILERDLQSYKLRAGESCTVASGVLLDPYTAKKIKFVRGVATSDKVQIDHVVAVSDAWQKGAQKLSASARKAFYNDPLNLLAVDGPTNSAKGDGDAATWLPPNKAFRCKYVARQVAVKLRYHLWVTSAEKTAIAGVLRSCPTQKLPTK